MDWMGAIAININLQYFITAILTGAMHVTCFISILSVILMIFELAMDVFRLK